MNLLKDLKSPDGLRGLFSIVLTATVLTSFEIVFFYLVVAPGVIKSMDNGIDDLTDVTQEAILTSDFINKIKKNNGLNMFRYALTSDQFINIFNTFDYRESKLTKKINSYTKKTGMIIIMMLILIMIRIYNALGKEPLTLEPVFSALLTVIILILFQGYFYFFGQKFKYPGSYGSEELLSLIAKKLEKDVQDAKQENNNNFKNLRNLIY